MATQMASSPTLPIEQPHLARSPRLYYCDSILTTDFTPTIFVDIGDAIDRKKELAAMHESQMAHMKLTGGWTLVEQIEVAGRYRGMQSGVEYAEAFQVCWSFPRGRAFSQLPVR
jgi:LmbE family N-acetylglucosaminyl deacetylase